MKNVEIGHVQTGYLAVSRHRHKYCLKRMENVNYRVGKGLFGTKELDELFNLLAFELTFELLIDVSYEKMKR